MAYNPFLSMTEPAAPLASEVLNPFMVMDTDSTAFPGDNPFATSNPFSDFGGDYEPAAGDILPADIFGGVDPASIEAKQFDGLTSHNHSDMNFFDSQPGNERLVKPTELDLISTLSDHTMDSEDFDMHPSGRPLPPETQNLILSVTGQMDFTSSHLLDRIPLTRTPSPVSARDIHSPSPTLEPEPEPEPEPEAAPPLSRSRPARPPPARPPPAARPPPPRPAPPPKPQPAKHAPPLEDINLFDAPAPICVKPTKEAILSLYSAPKKEEKQRDFLSDDLLDEISSEPPYDTEVVKAEISTPVKPVNNLDLAIKETVPVQAAEPTTLASSLAPESETPMDCTEPPSNIFVSPSNTSPFSDTVYDDQRFHPYSRDVENNPFESNETGDETFAVPPTDIFGLKPSDPVLASSSDVYEDTPTKVSISPGVSQEQHGDVFDTTQTQIGFGGKEADMFNAEEEEEAFDTSQEGARHAAALPAAEPGWGPAEEAMAHDAFPESQDAFDAFSAKFDSTSANHVNTAAWGDDGAGESGAGGFEAEAFDPFLSMGPPPPPAHTPRQDRPPSTDSPDDTFSLFIRPKESGAGGEVCVPALAPPPRAPEPDAARANPFAAPAPAPAAPAPALQLSLQPAPTHELHEGGGETPPTPLFDDDVSMPLEVFPRTQYAGPGWEMHLRQPNKKKITGQRFWKKIFVRLTYQGDSPVVQLYNAAGDREPFQELPLQACYSVSEVGAQQFDQFGKIFTVKLQYVFYKERPGVRPGQVTKAERITNKLSQFAAYAIQGDYQGVKEFGSDLRKLGLPVEHAPQVSQLFKLGSLSFEDVKQFSCCVEEALFRLPAHRDRALSYKMEEVQVTAVDELYVEQDAEGSVLKQIARVRLFFLGFLSGMPDVELGVNDLRRQGREVVGRHDIIPVVTEEWIRVEDTEFHACVQPEEFTKSQIIKFKPPDACYIELMRFRVRPPKNRELPLQLKAAWCVAGNKVELRADVLVPGFASRKLGQVPCEDVAIRFPIPECWIYLFRVEKHFRYGSVKSAHRRTGKIKGIERFLGAVDTLQESLIEVTSGQAKYEHQHRAIVWRMPRLPKEGQGAYTTHNLVCRMALTSYDQVPPALARHALVEFTMPAAQVSHTTVRSISLQSHDGDPPEKCVRYLARHEYLVGIERTSGPAAAAYAIAAGARPEPPPQPEPAAEPEAPALPQPPSSDSDSD